MASPPPDQRKESNSSSKEGKRKWWKKRKETDYDKLKSENEKLKEELEFLDHELRQQYLRNDSLESLLREAKEDPIYTKENWDRLEDDFCTMSKRAESAESKYLELWKYCEQERPPRSEERKKKYKQQDLSEACGSRATQTHSNEAIAAELKATANNAERFLRQLLIGVENLRLIADNIESCDRLENQGTHEKEQGPSDR